MQVWITACPDVKLILFIWHLLTYPHIVDVAKFSVTEYNRLFNSAKVCSGSVYTVVFQRMMPTGKRKVTCFCSCWLLYNVSVHQKSHYGQKCHHFMFNTCRIKLNWRRGYVLKQDLQSLSCVFTELGWVIHWVLGWLLFDTWLLLLLCWRHLLGQLVVPIAESTTL